MKNFYSSRIKTLTTQTITYKTNNPTEKIKWEKYLDISQKYMNSQ